MKKIHFMFAAMLFTVMNAFAAEGDVTYYEGDIDVTMLGNEITKDQPVTVSLTEGADGTFTFLLPDFKIMVGGAELPCGDIDVPGVTMTDDNGDGILDVNGKREDLCLAQDAPEPIWADVVISGTNDITMENMNLGIDVLWYPNHPDKENSMPIQVIFSGKKKNESSVDSVVGAQVSAFGLQNELSVCGFNGTVAVYALDGRLVKTFEACENTTVSIESGVYVVSAGQDAVKVVVK